MWKLYPKTLCFWRLSEIRSSKWFGTEWTSKINTCKLLRGWLKEVSDFYLLARIYVTETINCNRQTCNLQIYWSFFGTDSYKKNRGEEFCISVCVWLYVQPGIRLTGAIMYVILLNNYEHLLIYSFLAYGVWQMRLWTRVYNNMEQQQRSGFCMQKTEDTESGQNLYYLENDWSQF